MKIQLSFSSSAYTTLKQQPKPIQASNAPVLPDQAVFTQQLRQWALSFREAISISDYQAAYQAASQVLKLIPHHPTAKMDLAFTELRLGRYEAAYQHYLDVLKLQRKDLSQHVYDGLVEVCLALNLTEEQKKYGTLSLLHKQRQVEKNHILTFPKQRPKFDPSQPAENIISFALNSADPRDCESAILTVQHAREIFPEWTCRFYIHSLVPIDVQIRLKIAGADVIYVPQQYQHYPVEFWRFLVMGDPKVKFFLIRDVNMLLSRRECAAVNEWLESEFWFHHMRDYATHTELLLSTHLGGCVGPFKQIDRVLQQYWQLHQHTQKKQQEWYFLRQMWSTISLSLLSHDSQGYSANARDFPHGVIQSEDQNAAYGYVGMDLATPLVEVKVQELGTEQVRWHLLDADEHTVCAYDALVDSGKIKIHLPRLYTDYLTAGQWKICLQAY